jgi:asparagine synthase (glutamine-hydrolysing)
MTFSVDYVDNDKFFQTTAFQPNSDSRYIGIMRHFIDSDHTNVIIEPLELADALYPAVDARDLPGMADVDSSLLLFAARIKEKATVGLSGECADEIFGGYPWYRNPEIREREGFPWAQSTDFRAGLLRNEFASQIDAHGYVKERYDETVRSASSTFANGPLERRMREMTMLNMRWFMQTLLDRKDRMTMYNGLEVRVPFCDHRIAEYMYSTPWEYKEYEGKEKGLLRYAMVDALPEAIANRKKSPYPKTWHPAYMEIVSKRLRDVLASSSAPLTQIVRKDALLHLLTEGRPSPWYGQLMTGPQIIAYMLQLNYWLERYGVEIIG